MNRELLESREETEIDLLELVHAIWSKIWLVIIVGIIGVLMAGGYTKYAVTPQYSATSTIYIFGNSTSISSIANMDLTNQLSADFQILAQSRAVLEKTLNELNLDMSYGELASSVSVSNPADTHFLKLTVTNPDPDVAMEISNKLAEVAADRVAEVMNTDRPNLMEKAVSPVAPSSPNLMKNAFLGGVVGAVLVILLVIIQVLMNDKISTAEDVQKYLGLNVLASLPLEKKKKVRES